MHTGAVAGLTIREARPQDETALLALDRATWSPHSSPAPGPPDGPFFNDRTAPADIRVAELDGRLVAYAKVQNATGLQASAHVWACNGLAVDPDVQGRVVGRTLMQAVIDEARARGLRKLTLRVFGPNERARRLYERLGFEVEGVLRGEFRVGDEYIDDYLLALDLTHPSHSTGRP